MNERIVRLKSDLKVNFAKAKFTPNDLITLKQVAKKKVEIVFGKYYVNGFSIRRGKQSLYSIVRLHYFGFIKEEGKGQIVISELGRKKLNGLKNKSN